MKVKNEIPTGRTTWINGSDDPMPNEAERVRHVHREEPVVLEEGERQEE